MPFGIISNAILANACRIVSHNPRARDVIYSTGAKRSCENMLITLAHTMLADPGGPRGRDLFVRLQLRGRHHHYRVQGQHLPHLEVLTAQRHFDTRTCRPSASAGAIPLHKFPVDSCGDAVEKSCSATPLATVGCRNSRVQSSGPQREQTIGVGLT